MLRAYTPQQVNRVLKQSAKYGGAAAAKVMKAKAPVGTSSRLSQYYRKMGLKHGTLRRSVRAAAIRKRGIGAVIGPMGSKAFTRHWVEARMHWTASLASTALSVAHRASDAVLTAYARHPR